MERVSIGVPFYGAQDAQWWSTLVAHVGALHRQGIELGQLHTSGAMSTDHNRNAIVHDWLASDVEWMLWIDADTVVPIGALQRLLATGKQLVSGLYYGKAAPHVPIAYARTESGAYRPIDRVRTWERGEIIAVDAVGFGCMLTHRSVFEDIRDQYTVVQRYGGGVMPIHKDDIRGKIRGFDQLNKRNGMVINGVQQVQVMEPDLENLKFPFFVIEFGRTEDLAFFEMAARVGYKPWLDTSVECGHLWPQAVTGTDYRKDRGEWYG